MARRNKNHSRGSNINTRSQNDQQSKRDGKPEDKSESREAEQSSSTDAKVSKNASNDPEWYNADPQLLKDSASFPYAYPLGDRPQLGTTPTVLSGDKTITVELTDVRGVPGICSLRMKPTIGTTRSRKDPANVAAQAFYTHVRYVNSGRKNYEAPDLMMYALAIADLYSFIFWCQRLYGYAFTYSATNKYIGDALITANQVSPDDLRLNLANFRYWLNAFINKVSAWVVPSDIAYFKRRAFLYANCYIENKDGNIKDQLYQFVPDGFFQFGLDSDSRGMLKYINLVDGSGTSDPNFNIGFVHTVSSIMALGNKLIENITGDEDFGLMAGDILKSYEGNIIGLGSIPEEVYIVPTYDEYVLSQFKNATIIPVHRGFNKFAVQDLQDTDSRYGTGDIYQSKLGDLICCEVPQHHVPSGNTAYNWARAVAPSAYAHLNKFISVMNPDPNPADSIEASRLMVHFSTPSEFVAKDNSYGYQLGSDVGRLYTGSEIVVQCLMTQAQGENGVWKIDSRVKAMNSNVFIVPGPSIDLSDFDTASAFQDLMQDGALLGFKFSPHMAMMYVGPGSNANSYVMNTFNMISNIDNYTIIGEKEISKMHECALLSLFFVPGVAKMVNYGLSS